MNGHPCLCQSVHGFLEGRAIPATNRHGSSQQCQLPRDRPADTAAPARDECHTTGQQFLFLGVTMCFVYPQHENSSSYGPLFLCDTHPIIRVFRRTWEPLVALRETSETLRSSIRNFLRSSSQRKGTSCR